MPISKKSMKNVAQTKSKFDGLPHILENSMSEKKAKERTEKWYELRAPNFFELEKLENM